MNAAFRNRNQVVDVGSWTRLESQISKQWETTMSQKKSWISLPLLQEKVALHYWKTKLNWVQVPNSRGPPGLPPPTAYFPPMIRFGPWFGDCSASLSRPLGLSLLAYGRTVSGASQSYKPHNRTNKNVFKKLTCLWEFWHVAWYMIIISESESESSLVIRPKRIFEQLPAKLPSPHLRRPHDKNDGNWNCTNKKSVWQFGSQILAFTMLKPSSPCMLDLIK